MEKEIALEKRLKPIVEPLKRIAEHTECNNSTTNIVIEEKSQEEDITIKKRKLENEYDDVFTPKIVSTPRTVLHSWKRPRLTSVSDLSQQYEDVFETSSDQLPSLETSVKQTLQTPQGRDDLNRRLGSLGRLYITFLLSGEKPRKNDHVYGVYFGNDGLILGDKQIEINIDDSIIIDGITYAGIRFIRIDIQENS